MAAAVDAGIIEAWLASTEDGAVAVDASGLVVLHNPAASRVTGLAPGDAGGRSWRDVLNLSDATADLLWTARATRRSVQTLADVLCAQGNLRSAEIVAHPWTDAVGRVGVLVLIRDLRVLCRHRTGPGGRPGYGSLVGADPAMESLYDLVEAVAPSDAPVVIEGEPGTGKELVAQLVHARSARAERPLIAVDCASLAPASLEVELFGQARSALPGAGAVIGRVELAHTGTLFLDRVDEAPPAVQQRLVRLLGTGTSSAAARRWPGPWTSAWWPRPAARSPRSCAMAASRRICYAGCRWSGSSCPRCGGAGAMSRSSPTTSCPATVRRACGCRKPP
jgi:PAS domain S-box-containing protein